MQAERGDARGVRDYRPGDRRPRVHWPASAHAGRLMIRELETPLSQPITLSVQLPADGEVAERIAGQALGTIVELLDRGVPVVLATQEEAGHVTGPVTQRREAGRRLARATAGTGTAGLDVLP